MPNDRTADTGQVEFLRIGGHQSSGRRINDRSLVQLAALRWFRTISVEPQAPIVKVLKV